MLEDRRMLSAAQLVSDINQQTPAIGYDQGIEVDGVLYFAGQAHEADGVLQYRFWKYDPRANSGEGKLTQLGRVEDGVSNPKAFLTAEGKVYFISGSGHLWQYDPAAADGEGELTKLADFRIEAFSTGVVCDGSLYYRVTDSQNNLFLIRYQIEEQTLSYYPTGTSALNSTRSLVTADGKVYFHLRGDQNEFQLWQFDPTAEQSAAMSIVVSNLTYEGSQPDLASAGGKIYFPANDGTHGLELWSYDPTGNDGAGSTSLVANVYYGAGDANPSDFAVLDGKLYLKMKDYFNGIGLWCVDPQLDSEHGGVGYLNIESIGYSARDLHASGDSIYFSARDDANNWAMWRYIPRQNEFQLVSGSVSAASSDPDSAIPQQAIDLGGVLALTIDDRLWTFDPVFNGGEGRFVPVAVTVPSTQSSSPHSYLAIDNVFYFVANDGIHGEELWRYDPNDTSRDSTPELVVDLFPGIDSSSPSNLTVYEDKLIFRATTEEGLKLVQYDLTTRSVTILADLWGASPLESASDSWVLHDGKIYLTKAGPQDLQLLFYDLRAEPGTGEFAFAVNLPNRVFANARYFTSAGNKIFFDAYNLEFGRSLYEFDTSANDGLGELKRVDSYEGAYIGPRELVSLAGRVYLVGYDIEHGGELWEYDPEANGGLGVARRISDMQSGLFLGPTPQQMTVVGDKVYYQVVERGSDPNFQLWQYDPLAREGAGSLTQVFRLDGYSKEVYGLLQNGNSAISNDGLIYFFLISPSGNREIWQYNTRSTGQPGLAPVVNAKDAHILQEILPLDGKLYFNASTPPLGTELYVVDDLASTTWVQFAFTSGASTSVGTVRSESTPVEPVLEEWEDANGQLWINLGDDVPTGSFNFSVQVQVDNPAFADLIVTSHLGTNVTTNLETVDGVRTFEITFADLDLSGYEPGDQVLLADVLLPLDAETTSWLSMDPAGTYPQPSANHGVTLTAATNQSIDAPMLYDRHVPGQFQAMVYDSNDDGAVGLADFAGFVSNFGKTVNASNPGAYRFDFNRDGKIGLADFALFAAKFGQRKINHGPASSSGLAIEGEPTDAESRATNPDSWQLASDFLAADLASPASLSIAPSADEAVDQPEADFPLVCATQAPWDPRVVDAILQARDEMDGVSSSDDDGTASENDRPD